MIQTSNNKRQVIESDLPTLFALVESLQEPACIMKPDGLLLVVNSPFALRFGKTPEACLAAGIYDLLDDTSLMQPLAGPLKQQSAAACSAGKSAMFEDRDGGWNVTINPVRAASGAITSLFVTIRDVPEKSAASEEDGSACHAGLSLPLQAARAGVWEWSAKSGEVRCSDETWSICGIERGGDRSGFDRFRQALHPDDREKADRMIEQLSVGVSEIDTEFRVVQPDGSVRWFMWRGKSVLDNEGHPERSFGAIIDITEQKRLEEELRSSKLRMEQALQVSHVGVWEKDFQTGSLIWSDTLWSLFGFDSSRQQLTFDLWKNALHPEDRKVIESAGRAISAGEDMNVEYRIVHADGPVRWFMSRGSAVRNDDGGFDRYIGIVIDITGRKLLEEELVESKTRYAQALDAAHAGIWEWNVLTDELSWSDQVWKLYGLTPGSQPLNHQFCVETVHAEDRQMVSQLIKAGVADLEDVSVEYRVIHPDGSVCWLISRGMPVFDANGQLARYIGTIIDITARKQIELELIANRKRLGHALEAARAGVWEWDLATGENIWSDECWPLYGLSRDAGRQPSYDLWLDSVHPEDREKTVWLLTAAIRRQAEVNIEYRTIHDDGSIHWIMSRGKPLRDEQGKVARYIGTVIDITEKKIAEIRLKENRFRFNFALDAAGAGIWEWDVRADRLFWSDKIWKLYGLQPQGNIASRKLWSTNIHAEDHDLTLQTIMSAADRQEDFTVEYRVCQEGGAIRWLMCRGVPLPSPDEQTTRYLGMVMDITDRRRAEEERKKSREQLNLVLEKGNIGVFTLDLKTSKAQRSHQHARIFGYDSLEGEWTPSSFLAHVVPEERQAIRQIIERCFETRENYSFECRIHTASNRLRWIWFFGTFSYDSSTGTPYLLGIVQDITDRKQSELFLKESEQKFRNIFELSPVAIGIGDLKDNRLFDVNPAWLRLFDLTPEKVIGKKLRELALMLHAEDHDAMMRDLEEHGRVSNRQLELQSLSGKTITVLFSAEKINMNARSGVLMMMSDITVQELQQASINQLEGVVAERTERLREELKRLHLFLSMISHEYRTPLAIIRGNLDLIDLKSRAGDFAHQREMGKIRQAIERLVEVMEVSIQESRIQESSDELTVTTYLAEPAILSQLEAFQSMWPERTIDYSCQIDGAEITGEPGQFKMAVFNLLDNARKYSPPESPIELECRLENGEVMITVRNEAKGISGAECNELFEKYRRGSNAANTGGAGIGLWLVRDIIEHHHGRVTLTGTASGVEAVISLPLAAQKV